MIQLKENFHEVKLFLIMIQVNLYQIYFIFPLSKFLLRHTRCLFLHQNKKYSIIYRSSDYGLFKDEIMSQQGEVANPNTTVWWVTTSGFMIK